MIFEFHYNYIGVKYGGGAKLFFADTDSLVYEIETDDVYQDSYKDIKFCDFSNYPKDSQFYDLVNKKVIGKMKDEVRRNIRLLDGNQRCIL